MNTIILPENEMIPTINRINTHSVFLFKKNKYEEAMQGFLDGLRKLHRITAESERMASSSVGFSKTSSLKKIFPEEASQVPRNDVSPNQVRVPPPPASYATCGFSVCNQAIVLRNEHIIVSRDDHRHSSDCQSIMASVLLCNLALVYHRVGVKRSSSLLLKKALKGYILSRKTAALFQRRIGGGEHEAFISRILFTTTNNLGEIYSRHLFDMPRARQCADFLLLILPTLRRLLPEKDFASVYTALTMMLGDMQMLRAAPAA